MVENKNRIKGVEVLFTILFLVIVSGTLHAQTYSGSSMGNDTNSQSNNMWSNNAASNQTGNTTQGR